MVKRKVTILQTAATAVAEIAFFIESKGLPSTAKKFVDEAFSFFETLADNRVEHRKCNYKKWKDLDYRSIVYKKKYLVVFISASHKITICDFVLAKLIKE
jgi:hypothetical protein